MQEQLSFIIYVNYNVALFLPSKIVPWAEDKAGGGVERANLSCPHTVSYPADGGRGMGGAIQPKPLSLSIFIHNIHPQSGWRV